MKLEAKGIGYITVPAHHVSAVAFSTSQPAGGWSRGVSEKPSLFVIAATLLSYPTACLTFHALPSQADTLLPQLGLNALQDSHLCVPAKSFKELSYFLQSNHPPVGN